MINVGMVEPVRLNLKSKFKFMCHKGIGCFTRCCGSTDILLTPYDVVRIKNRLGISSSEFLKQYTTIQIDENSKHPNVILKMGQEGQRRCPFVTEEGCTIYEDRPTNCRYYPLGQAIMRVQKENKIVNEEFYFLIKDENCLGYSEDREWTVEEWRIDQGADIYDEMNKEWKEIQLRRDPQGESMDETKQKLFYMASYDLDAFRKFLRATNVLDFFEIDNRELEDIQTDEIALMRFAFKYLKYIFMLEETLKLKEEYKEKFLKAYQSKGN